MLWESLAKAICLMLVIEGILPFLYPSRWRKLVATLALIDDQKLRIGGLISMIIGVVVLMLMHN